MKTDPFLHEDRTKKTRDYIRNYLQKLGYKNGYVTVNNYEWYMDALLKRALAEGKTINYKRLKNAYVESLWETITFYDNIALQVLGRSPKHVLLLHGNDITALFIDDLVQHIRSKGWKIISAEEAYSDPIAFLFRMFHLMGKVWLLQSQGVKGLSASNWYMKPKMKSF